MLIHNANKERSQALAWVLLMNIHTDSYIQSCRICNVKSMVEDIGDLAINPEQGKVENPLC